MWNFSLEWDRERKLKAQKVLLLGPGTCPPHPSLSLPAGGSWSLWLPLELLGDKPVRWNTLQGYPHPRHRTCVCERQDQSPDPTASLSVAWNSWRLTSQAGTGRELSSHLCLGLHQGQEREVLHHLLGFTSSQQHQGLFCVF